MEPASLDAPLSLRSEVSDVSSGNRRRQVRPQRGPHERSDPGAVSRRDNAAMGPNSASPSPQPRSDSYGLARRDARGLFARLFLPG
jgi:hypothetical protein